MVNKSLTGLAGFTVHFGVRCRMAKLIIQIPAFNEADHLEATIADLPKAIAGIDTIEYLLIDDGSSDGTAEKAKALGVHHIVRHRRNRGLAAAFTSGLEFAIAQGADIIVNTDADNQYDGRDIPALVEPILDGTADLVIGDRGVGDNVHFGSGKRGLQRLGSAVVRRLSGIGVKDAVSGFRAMSREAACQIFVASDFSYTTEMLVQAGRKRLSVVAVPVRTNGPVRPSRLFNSIPHFLSNTGTTILRAYAMYNALRVFVFIGILLVLGGTIPILRFLYFLATDQGQGHIQSLILGVGLMVLGGLSILLGVVADLVGANRKLIEQVLRRIQRIEDHQMRSDDGHKPED